MFKKLFLYLKNFDWILFFAVLLLICFGLVEIYSVALGQGDANLLNFKKQAIFVFIGLGFLFFFAFLNYHTLSSLSGYFYIFGAVLLLAVLFLGKTIRGTRGWFSFGGFSLQPVELIKFILILFLARYFSDSFTKGHPFKHFLITGTGVLVFMALVLMQPDFGSALLLFASWLSLIFIVGFSKKYIISIFLVIAIFSGLAWGFYFKDYQKQRISTFLNPSFNPLDQGYNVAQAIIAVGAGGILGRGIGFGSQSQLKFLPESQNDFIFAVVCEELGLLGVFMVMLLFSVFFYRCFVALRKNKNNFAVFFIIGSACLIFIEMFINIGMNIGILPVVGISLPFLSYGGSAMISNMIIVGVIQSIIIRSKVNY